MLVEVLLAVVNLVQVLGLAYIAILAKKTVNAVNGEKPSEKDRDTS
jgi:hypothetical protein